MSRFVRCFVFATFLGLVPAARADWADKLFTETNYDFGSVARAAKVEHIFTIKNNTKDTIHLSGVRSSCGCTSPRLSKDTLKPGEEGQVIAAFNTGTFLGYHSATLTVTFDRPRWSEVRLHVNGQIRTDVVVNPSEISMGAVEQGAGAEKRVAINYAGKKDWKITGVKSDLSQFTAEAVETSRSGGKANYDLIVRLNPDAPVGYFRNQIWVETNDTRGKFPVIVDGSVAAGLTVSPASLLLTASRPGQEVTKQLIIKGKAPFKILGVESSAGALSFQADSEARQIQKIVVTFKAPGEPQSVTSQIQIRTDLAGYEVITTPVVLQFSPAFTAEK